MKITNGYRVLKSGLGSAWVKEDGVTVWAASGPADAVKAELYHYLMMIADDLESGVTND